MSVVVYVVLGLITGFLASKFLDKTGEGLLSDIVLGIVGALVGGWIFGTFGMGGGTGFDIWNVVVSVGGALLFLVVYHALRVAAPRRTIYR